MNQTGLGNQLRQSLQLHQARSLVPRMEKIGESLRTHQHAGTVEQSVLLYSAFLSDLLASKIPQDAETPELLSVIDQFCTSMGT